MRRAALLSAFILMSCGSKDAKRSAAQTQVVKPKLDATPKSVPDQPNRTSTQLLAHNVIIYESSGLKLKVRWLRGRMYPTRASVNPSFDKPDSFRCEIDDGVMGSDLANFSDVLNSYVFKNSPLHNVKLAGVGQQVKVSGVLQKGLPLPVQITGLLDASSDGRMHIHVNKISLLKIPLKDLLNGLHLKTEDLFDPKGVQGLDVVHDDIYIDTGKVTPPPHVHGKLTRVSISNSGELMETYGVPRPDVVRVKQWRNFMSLKGGTIDFGKLTMHDADMYIIDTSQDDWFQFDLSHYQQQLVNGYTRITPHAGLQMFMTDISKVPNTKANRDISLQWLKDRHVPPPADVPKQ